MQLMLLSSLLLQKLTSHAQLHQCIIITLLRDREKALFTSILATIKTLDVGSMGGPLFQNYNS